ncbi:ABC transporter permease family protein [Mesomycoplasma molare]|uniref:Carbohydrate ABC transporter permease n=1 Tax=Mesomycoplasma molare TaxID=171288 RepID=A0ABY5TVG8_9BACT|nr:carbohydrate ABC transporter permease [Mesomycoplasma molare]UWD34545.1 carbohydrate ABC transporter permease [Mesomycoplasma molare]
MKKIIKVTIIFLLLFLLLFFIFFPIYFLILVSLKSNQSFLNNEYSLIIDEWNFKNYSFLKEFDFWKAILISLISSFVLIIIRMIIYFGFIISFYNFSNKFKKTIQLILMILFIIPEFSIFLSLKNILNILNISSNLNYFSLISNSLFSFFLLNNMLFNYTKTKDKYYKIIIIDNLNFLEQLKLIYWKEMKHSFFMLVVFSFITTWNDFLWVNFLLSGSEDKTLAIWFRYYAPIPTGGYFLNLQAAGAFVSIFIPITIYFIFSKQITKIDL